MQRTGRSSKKRLKFMGQLDRVTERDVVMDYEKMKALMEANREELGLQRKPEVIEFSKPYSMSDFSPDWKYLDYAQKEQKAA